MESEIRALEEAAIATLDVIVEAAAHKKPLREQDTTCTIPVGPFTRGLVMAGMMISEYIGGVQYFYADSNCTGCGICGKGCLSGKIRMEEGPARLAEGRLLLHVRCKPLTSAPGRPSRSGTSRG